MQRLINEGITQNFDMKDLQRLVPHGVRVIRYDSLYGVKTLKAAMGRSKALLILWNIHDKQHRLLNTAGHFFVLAVLGGKPFVFSSTGFSPRKELFMSHSDPDVFDRILPKNVAYNSTRLQANRNSSTCWRYCLLFCELVVRGGMDPRVFTHRISRPLHLHTSDQVITALTFDSLFAPGTSTRK